jgi:outer membrane lipoprotein-sorting protein
VPVAAAAVVAAAAGAGPVIAAVQGDPALPERSAEQLLAAAINAGKSGQVPQMSGTVVETASLGLPGLPDVGGGSSSPTSLLAGSNQLKVWYGGSDKIRLALPGRMTETDLIQNGDQTWLWESSSNTATRIKTPQGGVTRALESRAGDKGEAHPSGPPSAESSTGPSSLPSALPSGLPTALTPQEAAQELLKRAGGDTTITVTNTEQVAGRAAYQLSFAPKDSASLVKQVTLALDGETYVPLRVQVYADGAAEPAFEVGFSSVTFTPPAPEMFAFTPPAGAKVTEKTLGAHQAGEQKPGTPTTGDQTPRPQKDSAAASGDTATAAEKLRAGAKTIGQGWTTVVSLPFSQQDLAKATSGKGSPRYGGHGDGGVSQLTKGVLDSAKRVSGAWGSGKLIQTKLVSILLTDDGRVLAGAVTPETLTDAAGKK